MSVNEILAGLKKEFTEKYPSGATFKEAKEFIRRHRIFRHSQEAQEEFLVYMSRVGE